LEEVGLVAEDRPSAFERRLGMASKVLAAVTEFLAHVAALLRQLLHVAGWIILLAGCVELLIRPHFSPEHLVMPGAGTFAVLQSHIRLWRHHDQGTPPDEPPSGPVLTIVP
jgi:hypothetical protein